METESKVVKSWLESAKENSGSMVVFGILALIAGFICLVWPWASGLGVTLVIGVALTLGGIARLVGAFSAGSFGTGALAFIGGALTVLVGIVMVVRPGVGLAGLTLMLGCYLLVDGIFGSVLAFQVRPEQGWGWLLFSGIVGFLLGILLLYEWPLSGIWAVGSLTGVNLLFAGVSMISIGSAAKNLVKSAA